MEDLKRTLNRLPAFQLWAALLKTTAESWPSHGSGPGG